MLAEMDPGLDKADEAFGDYGIENKETHLLICVIDSIRLMNIFVLQSLNDTMFLSVPTPTTQ